MNQQNWNAKDYAKYSKAQEVWAKELITKLELKGDENILDLGCGDGKVTALLSTSTDGKIVGVDKSEAMVALAKTSYSDIEFMVMDATELTFEKQFDIVFSNAVLHWVHNHEAVLRGIKKALKPNGKILLQFGGYGNAKAILNIMESFIDKNYAKYFANFEFPYNFPHNDTYTKLLEKVGFRDINARLIPKDMAHENIDAFKGWIRTTWFPYTDCLPKSMREEFIDGLVKEYLKISPLDEKGKVHVEMIRLEIEAIVYS